MHFANWSSLHQKPEIYSNICRQYYTLKLKIQHQMKSINSPPVSFTVFPNLFSRNTRPLGRLQSYTQLWFYISSFSCNCNVLYVTYNASELSLWCHVFMSTLTLPVGQGRGGTFHVICGFIWTFALSLAGTQTDPVPSDSWMLIPDQKVKCILQIWYTDFLNLQPSKCNNALNFNMWLHLTSVSLPINSFQLWFFGGERNAWQARLKLVKLNSAWNILLHQIVLALSHFWTCPSNLNAHMCNQDMVYVSIHEVM